MTPPPYRLEMPPRQDCAVIFASPHSGRHYDPAFLARSVLCERMIRSSEDAFVDQLFAAAPAHGAPFLVAQHPRAWLDLNRAADELDPAVVAGVQPAAHNPRINSGLGVIPRVVAGGRAIYRGKLTRAEAEARLLGTWHPYHRALEGLMVATRAEFGLAVLIDCHSMPHEAVESLAGPAARRPQVVLGDRFGSACAPAIMDRVEAAFAAAGLRVARNAPFAGAYVTRHYGRPSAGRHVVQVEIDRALYMDEAEIRLHRGFGPLRDALTGVIAEITRIGRAPGVPLAAE